MSDEEFHGVEVVGWCVQCSQTVNRKINYINIQLILRAIADLDVPYSYVRLSKN